MSAISMNTIISIMKMRIEINGIRIAEKNAFIPTSSTRTAGWKSAVTIV
jgi:hypothetical protein